MGRKIPGKKHRKVVDPEKQRSIREASLKDKINKPPKNPDEQEVPKSVLLLSKLKKKANSLQKNKKAKKNKRKRNAEKPLCLQQFLGTDKIQSGMTKPDKFIPNLIQRPQETEDSFYRRVNIMTQEIIKEAQFEDKFGVEIKKDLKTGRILQVEKNKKNLKKNMRKSRKMTLKEKRKEKKMKKLEEDVKDFSHLKDKVEFGEVVHRPPVNLKLSTKINNDTSKGNKYKNLLLQDLIKNKNKARKEPIQLQKEEKQRQFIVNAYRERKKLQNQVIM